MDYKWRKSMRSRLFLPIFALLVSSAAHSVIISYAHFKGTPASGQLFNEKEADWPRHRQECADLGIQRDHQKKEHRAYKKSYQQEMQEKARKEANAQEHHAILEKTVAQSGVRRESILGADSNGNTILHLAVDAKDTHRIEQILAALELFEISVVEFLQKRNNTGSTPLICAARNNYKTGVRLLLEAFNHAGGDALSYIHLDELTNQNTTGYPLGTALHEAANQRSLDVLTLLLDEEAHPDVRNINGSTPLHYAGNAAVVHLLISRGALVDAQDETQETPLHNAARANQKAVVQDLLEKGADRAIENLGGQTAAQVTDSREIKILLATYQQRRTKQAAKKK
jgi:cytohesin